jgi:hypothetical protein
MLKELFPVPVVFIIFNRPDEALRTFSEIAKIKPSKLLIIGDGPRRNVPGEEAKVLEARAIIDSVDWDCEVLTHFSEENLGCKHRVASGLDWAFGLVEEAIILEDDCLPSHSFFLFCREMLEKYRNHSEVGMIAGINFQKGARRGNADYYFSKYMHIWGWATWSNRWRNYYDVQMKDWPTFRDSKEFLNITSSLSNRNFWVNIFDKVYRGEIGTWDYQWVFVNWLHKRFCIIPNINLISNIGFGQGATHTKVENALSNLPAHEMSFPLKHPDLVEVNVQADEFTEKNYFSFSVLDLLKKVVNKLLRVFK